VGVWGCLGVWVWGCGGVGVVSPCVRTFQGLHSVRLWTPTINRIGFELFLFSFSSSNIYVTKMHKSWVAFWLIQSWKVIVGYFSFLSNPNICNFTYCCSCLLLTMLRDLLTQKCSQKNL
jgi:hypothetical protein